MVGTLFLEESYKIQAILVQKAPQGIIQSKRIGGSDYCTQSRRAIKSDNALPESKARWLITRAVHKFSGATLPQRAQAANNDSYARG